MKVLVMTARLMDVSDDYYNEDIDLMRYDLAQAEVEKELNPGEKVMIAFPTRRGFFTFGEVAFVTRPFALWAGKQVGQPMPEPTRPRQMGLTLEEQKAYDESLR